MGWQPEQERCPECGFEWSIGRKVAIDLVRQSPPRFDGAIAGSNAHIPMRPGHWSPVQYLWHMVDVLHIGTERLWTLLLDPANGVPCWDEKQMAGVRRYAELSLPVGLLAYARVAQAWVGAALDVPAEAETPHPEFGTIAALDVVRLNAHEVVHHLMDFGRS